MGECIATSLMHPGSLWSSSSSSSSSLLGRVRVRVRVRVERGAGEVAEENGCALAHEVFLPAVTIVAIAITIATTIAFVLAVVAVTFLSVLSSQAADKLRGGGVAKSIVDKLGRTKLRTKLNRGQG